MLSQINPERADIIVAGSAILLDVHTKKDCPLEKWGVEYHRESFRKVLKHRLKVEIYT